MFKRDFELLNLNNFLLIGMAIAVTISYSINKSVYWAILHGIINWFYVIYFQFFRELF